MARKAANGHGHLDRKKGRNGKPYGNWLIRYRIPGQKNPGYVNLETQEYDRACVLYHEWLTNRNLAVEVGVDPNQTFLAYIWWWFRGRERDQAQSHDVTPQTLVRYKNYVIAMEAFLKANNLDLLLLSELTPEVFKRFLAWRITQGRFHGTSTTVMISEAGANREWGFWHGILRKAFQTRLLRQDVTLGVKPFTFNEERLPLPSETELQEVFSFGDPEDQFIVEFLIFLVNTGARPGEGMHLHWKDVDFDKKYFHIRRDSLTGWTTKTKSSQRKVPMPEVVERLFLKFKNRRPHASAEDYVFMNEATGRPLHFQEHLAYKRLGKMLRRANRQRKKTGQSAIPQFTVRTLRAWFITWAMTRKDNPLSEVEVIKLVGHVDFQMIRKHYFRLDMDSPSAAKMRQGAALENCVLSNMLADGFTITAVVIRKPMGGESPIRLSCTNSAVV